jgi:uncharacterized caspase-like protein
MRRTALALKAIAIVLLSLAPCADSRAQTGAAQPPSASGRYYALVVGNDDYRSLPKLKTAAADAREVERVLREYYGFQTKLLLNATRSQVVAALSAYRRELSADSNLLIYYAGHGYNDRETEKTYWLPVDATRDDDSNWIIADEITSDIRAIPARHVLVVSDSCYSGTLTRGLSLSPPPGSEREQFLQKMMAGHSRTLMASGGDEPVADSGGGGHSVFAASLLHGLEQMERPKFTAGELFSNYVVEAVAGRADQTPVYDPLRNSGHESGDFVFVKIKTPDGKTVEVTVSTPPAKVDPAAFELSYWDSIKGSTDPEDFKAYLEKYPTGQFAALARNKINGLQPAAKPTEPAPSSGGPVELAFWDSIKNSTNAGDFKAYLDKYPNGEFAPLAKNRLASLEAAAKGERTERETAGENARQTRVFKGTFGPGGMFGGIGAMRGQVIISATQIKFISEKDGSSYTGACSWFVKAKVEGKAIREIAWNGYSWRFTAESSSDAASALEAIRQVCNSPEPPKNSRPKN